MQLTEVLKEHTKTAHAALEGKIIPAIKNLSDKAGYLQLLRLFYGYYAALEQRIAPQVNGKLADFGSRRKAGALLSDMRALQGDTETGTRLCEQLPDISSYPQALGALYVLEGSTLGGQIITQMIRQRVQEAETGLSFFNGYGDQTIPMWQRFKAVVNAYDGEAEQQAMLQAANDTFTSFQKWIAQHDAK